MKLSDAINRVDKSPSNTAWVDYDDFSQIFGYNDDIDDEEFSNRVKKYWIHVWCCTDTWVGTSVYYLDGVPFAIGYQSARKNPHQITFISKDAANTFNDFVWSLIIKQEKRFTVLSDSSLEDDVGEGWSVSYIEQLINKKVLYKGELVDVCKEQTNDDGWGNVNIEYQGKITRVEMSDVLVPLRVV